MSIKIVTDSACDLSRDIIEELEILMIPLNVLEGDREYKDKETILPKEIYQGMRDGKVYTTAQSIPNVIIDRITNELENGNDIIYICFSSGLSGQFQTSTMLLKDIKEKYPNKTLDIVDSKSACCGMGMIVKKAAEMVRDGKERQEILDMIDYYSKNIKHIILVGSMDYLYKGGRISKIQALTGGLLNIKPVVGMDIDGKLEFVDKVRGNKKLFKKTEQMIEEYNIGDINEQTIGLVYGDNEVIAEEFKALLETKFNPKDIILENIGASVAAHTGPEIIGITFLKQKYN